MTPAISFDQQLRKKSASGGAGTRTRCRRGTARRARGVAHPCTAHRCVSAGRPGREGSRSAGRVVSRARACVRGSGARRFDHPRAGQQGAHHTAGGAAVEMCLVSTWFGCSMKGRMPFTKTGKHRRVRIEDVLACRHVARADGAHRVVRRLRQGIEAVRADMLPAPFRVVLDANALYPFTLRDTALVRNSAPLARWAYERREGHRGPTSRRLPVQPPRPLARADVCTGSAASG